MNISYHTAKNHWNTRYILEGEGVRVKVPKVKVLKVRILRVKILRVRILRIEV